MLLLPLLHLLSPAFGEDRILDLAESELLRSWEILSQREEAAYWIGIHITDRFEESIRASEGSLLSPDEKRFRYADIDVRVGDFSFDNTHPLRDSGFFGEDTHFGTYLPFENHPKAVKTELWKTIDEAYRHSVRRLIKLRSNDAVKVEMEDQSADFSLYKGVQKTLPIQSHTLSKRQRSQWEEELKKQSKIFLEYTNVFASFVSLDVEREDYFVVTTDNTRLQHQRIHYRLSVYAKTKAADGMELRSYDYVDTHSLDGLPRPEEIEKMVRDSAQKVLALREAPLVDPFVGPAILRGRAAAVFFHEILGHRIEGHRQKDEDEGQTLSDKVGEQILPPFLSIEDNPIMRKWNGTDLNGFYLYDSEGSIAEQVSIVSNGVLKNFLMSRSPIENFSTSNGHGRREIGYPVVARQGNLIVSAAKTSSYDALRNQLIELIKEQEKPFGLIFDDISGGFTFTGRNSPNSYSVQPVTVWKVFPDGSPDELVRGVDLIGTPLITFGRIKAASDQTSVFNGNCGAESGWVPVSAIAPDLLVTEVEVQRKDKDTDRLPILPAPKGVKQ